MSVNINSKSKLNMIKKLGLLVKAGLLFTVLCGLNVSKAQVQQLGNSGSYRLDFPSSNNNYEVLSTVPWVDGVYEMSPSLSDNYTGKPIPSSSWWTSVIKPGHNTTQSSTLFAHPLSFQTTTGGLSIDYPGGISGERYAYVGHYEDILVGISGLNSEDCKAYDYSDWTATIEMGDASNTLLATIGHGMPFAYFEKIGSNNLTITSDSYINEIINENEVLVIRVNGVKYAAFAPAGSSWNRENNNTYSSSLNNDNYCSVALLPEVDGETDNSYPDDVLEEFRSRAYAFPTNTEMNYTYNELTANVETIFTVTTELKSSEQGLVNSTFMCLYPHQWAFTSTQVEEYSYESARGEMKTIDGNTFSVNHTFQGVVPTLPNVASNLSGYSENTLINYLEDADEESIGTWGSYNQGKMFNKFIPIVHIADQLGEIAIRDRNLDKIKSRLEDWLTTDASETSYLFYYNDEWDYLAGYPSEHYQASLLNDRHFHWGYFIQAAACVAQYDSDWVDEYGEMINLLIKDAANWDRSDNRFEYLRNMDPYAGHCWAGGSGASSNGNNMESSSESMNFNTGVILWGELTNNTEIRDLGVYLYTSEVVAIQEYWWDVNDRTFPSDWGFEAASRVYGSGLDFSTFWTTDYDAAYGINILPIQGGSTYLGYLPDYINDNWTDFLSNINSSTPVGWYDIFWSFLALDNPELAIEQFNANNDYDEEFGETKAHTYHWLHNLQELGQVETGITADYSLANVFNNDGTLTYVAQNYTSNSLVVTFSDGFEMTVPANTLQAEVGVVEEEPESDSSLVIVAASGVGTQINDDISVDNVYDNNESTRWSANGDNGDVYLDLELECTYEISSIAIMFYNGSMRTTDFQIAVSTDGVNFTNVTDVLTSEQNDESQVFEIDNNPEAKYIRIYGHGNSVNLWNSYLEIDVYSQGECIDDITGIVGSTSPSIVVFPNPAKSMIYLPEFDAYTIYSSQGEIVLVGESTGQNSINLASLTPGFYFVRTGKGAWSSFVKE